MLDDASILLERANSLQPRRYERVVLRSIVSAVFGIVCLLSVVFWFRSYTWRDRIVVPLSETRFSRVDSDHGKFEFESFGPNMGGMSFSVTALSHKKISRSWKRFMNVPQPGPGKKWRWEHTTTGRFFIHVPHWFVVGITLVFAGVPWLRWRYSLRALFVAITVIAATLGFWVWATATPKTNSKLLPAIEVDEDGNFEEILNAVDNVAGKRLHSMQIGAMTSATYQYSGSLDKVTEVIDPIAKRNGYASAETDETKQALQQGLEQANSMGNMKMDMSASKMYSHSNGNIIQVLIMDMQNMFKMPTKSKFLTIQLMNSEKMPEFGLPQPGSKGE